jgi:Reverse transcriptase (RNA-dependent DNA polymerase)/Endonuclease-reverse transcriptase
MLQNYRSIVGKVRKFQADVKIYDPDVIMGNESWLDDSIPDSQIFPSGYVIYRKDRNREGGGVFIAIKLKHKCQKIESELASEQLWVQIELDTGKKLRIGTGYRPPQSGDVLIRDLETMLTQFRGAQNMRKFVMFGGDLNLPSSDWNNNEVMAQPAYGQAVNRYALDVMNNHDLKQLVNEPTRIAEGHRQTLLDVIFTNQHQYVDSVVVTDEISDHKTVIADFCFSAINKNLAKVKRTIYQYYQANKNEIQNNLAAKLENFQIQAENKTSDEIWNMFEEICKSVQDQHIPQKTFIVNGKDPPWYNNYLRNLSKRCQRAHKRRNITQANSNRYRQLRRELKWKLYQAEDRFLENLGTESDTNSKRLWSYIKYKHSHLSRAGISYLRNNHGDLVSNAKEKANLLNEYFGTVFSQNQHVPIAEPPTIFDFPHEPPIISSDGILNIIKSLRADAAPGPDGMGPKFLKLAPEILSEYLKIIFEKSLSSLQLPLKWKQAHVVPIHKAGDKNNMQNYRPISLTCTACKILEHIIVSNISRHMDQNQLFNAAQHGFRKRLSCETQINSLHHKMVTTKDNGKSTDIVYLDFQKAFDKVPHAMLIWKLKKLGIHEGIYRWIKEYLNHREQRVVMEGVLSETVQVTSGVPQGSVLGPLLFILYINDITDDIESGIGLYADDCALFREINKSSDAEKLQSDLNKITDWSTKWLLPLNIDKCKSMRIVGSRTEEIECKYDIQGTTLEQVKKFKYLGVIISENLSWKEHIQYITNKASRMLGFLKGTMYGVSRMVKERAYKALIRPILEYCAVVWDPHHHYLINNIEAIQRKAARFISNNYQQQASVTAMLKEMELPTLQDRRQIYRLTALYKLVSGASTYELSNHVIQHPMILPRNHQFKLREINGSRNNDPFHHSFLPKTIREWNRLPKSLFSDAIATPEIFKNRVAKIYGIKKFN